MRMLLLGVLFSVALAPACKSKDEARSPAAVATHSVSNETAIQDITSARCDREQACNNIGSEKKFNTADACSREIDHDTRATLRVEECPKGIDGQELTTCLNDIRNERCSNPIDALERLTSCAKRELCL